MRIKKIFASTFLSVSLLFTAQQAYAPGIPDFTPLYKAVSIASWAGVAALGAGTYYKPNIGLPIVGLIGAQYAWEKYQIRKINKVHAQLKEEYATLAKIYIKSVPNPYAGTPEKYLNISNSHYAHYLAYKHGEREKHSNQLKQALTAETFSSDDITTLRKTISEIKRLTALYQDLIKYKPNLYREPSFAMHSFVEYLKFNYEYVWLYPHDRKLAEPHPIIRIIEEALPA